MSGAVETEREDLLYVRAGDAHYGIPVSWVIEVIPTPEAAVVPEQPDAVRGICLHQGRFLTVFSLGLLSGVEEEEPLAVVCRRDGLGFILTVAEVGRLIADGGPADAASLSETALPIAYVSRSEPPVLVLDPAGLLGCV